MVRRASDYIPVGFDENVIQGAEEQNAPQHVTAAR
jgi:hypothetical protein